MFFLFSFSLSNDNSISVPFVLLSSNSKSTLLICWLVIQGVSLCLDTKPQLLGQYYDTQNKKALEIVMDSYFDGKQPDEKVAET